MAKRFSFSKSWSELQSDRRGNFGMMAAIILPALLAGAGMAVDFSIANFERTNLQDVADSAVLAGGSVFDGTNLNAAKAIVVANIKSQASTTATEGETPDPSLGNSVTYQVSASGNTLQLVMKKSVPTTLMQIASIDAVQVGVAASALSPMKPEKITFTPTKAQGWYFKKISVLVTRPGSTAEEVLGTVTYQPTTQKDGGQGTYVAVPAGTIDLGKYTNLALRMDIKNDGCDIGYKAKVKNSVVTCNKSSDVKERTYSTVLRTDDPATSNHLFVDGKQVPVGVKASLEKYFGCTKKQEHAWEDGGGWERQDFFYTVTATCGADGQFVRLVK